MSTKPENEELLKLRDEIAKADREILEALARRVRLSERISGLKQTLSLPQRDYSQEKLVVSRGATTGAELGLPAEVVESLMLEIVRASSTVEERSVVRASCAGDGQRALVIGGAGKMGGWLTDFLIAQRFAVEIADLRPGDPRATHYTNWRDADLDSFDLIVVATPLGMTNEVLFELAAERPKGVVFDVGSLKSPVREGLLSLRNAGVRVTSVHPMFGPSTDLLSGRHIIFCDVGDEEATKRAKSLFEPTTAVLVEMDIESHDRLVAYVLGLSHALNIAFFTALAESGESAPRLARMSSTTFDAQLEIATDVSGESPELYYEIQALNDYGLESLAALSYAVERIRSVVRAGDEEAFVRLMLRGREYLTGRKRAAESHEAQAQGVGGVGDVER